MTTTSRPADRVERSRDRLEKLLQITSHAYDLQFGFGSRDGLSDHAIVVGMEEGEAAAAEYRSLKGRALHLLGHRLADVRMAAEQAESYERAGAPTFARWWHALEDARLENWMTRRWPGMDRAFVAKLPPNLGGSLLSQMSPGHQVEMGLYLAGRGATGARFSEPVQHALQEAADEVRRGARGESPEVSFAAMAAIYPRLRPFARRGARDIHGVAEGKHPEDDTGAARDGSSGGAGSGRETPQIVTDDDDRVWATPLGTQRQFPEWYRPGSAPWFERGQSEKTVHPSALQSDRQTILLPPRGDAAVYRGLWSEVQHETGHLLSRLVRSLQEETYLRFAGRHRSGTLAMSKLWKQRLADYRLFRRRQAGGRRQVAVCVLVDESASMKGHEKWRTAAKTVVLLGEALDRLDVPFEIIGFTTADYEARRALQLGLTPAFAYRAMRCSRLEHRLYKAFEEPYRSVRTRLSDIQPRHNNWDEEHLLFAHRRIRRRPEPSRVIIVVSDGQPNGEADHLIAAVAQVEREGGRIIGVGIGEDFAARIYGSAITAADFGGLAEALLGALGRELGVLGSAFGSRGMPVARPSGAAA